MTELVHPILTTEQAELTHQALVAFLNTPEGNLSENPGEEQIIKNKVSELVYFFNEVVDHPEQFGLRSEKEVKAILRAAKPVKGPAQPKSDRKRRQKQRPSWEKRTRQEKKQEALDYNEARLKTEAEQTEAQEAYEAEMARRIERFEKLAAKDRLTGDEFLETLDLLALEPVAARVRELQAEATPEAVIAKAVAARDAQADGDPLD